MRGGFGRAGRPLDSHPVIQDDTLDHADTSHPRPRFAVRGKEGRRPRCTVHINNLLDNTCFFFRQKFWADIPAPLLTKVYLFNVSNPKEVSSTGAKPILKEVGPFVFDEYHKKVKVQWNENNDTVTYQQIRTYFLDKVTLLMVLFICKKPWLKYFFQSGIPCHFVGSIHKGHGRTSYYHQCSRSCSRGSCRTHVAVSKVCLKNQNEISLYTTYVVFKIHFTPFIFLSSAGQWFNLESLLSKKNFSLLRRLRISYLTATQTQSLTPPKPWLSLELKSPDKWTNSAYFTTGMDQIGKFNLLT